MRFTVRAFALAGVCLCVAVAPSQVAAQNIQRVVADTSMSVDLATADGPKTVVADVAMYASDDLVRHAAALQAMPQAGDDCIRVCAETAESLGLAAGTRVALGPDGNRGVAELVIDDRVPTGACLVSAGRAALATSAVYGAAISLSAAKGDAAA